MATWNIISIVVLFAALSLTAADEPPECPPGNPLCNIWQPCDFTGHGPEPEVSCYDCTRQLVCTPWGGFVRPCWLPALKNCVDGACVRQPSDQCQAQAAEEAPADSVVLAEA